MVSDYIEHAKQFAVSKKLERRHIVYGTLIVLVLFFSAARLLNLSPYKAGAGHGQYFLAQVIKLQNTSSPQDSGNQNAQVKILDGPDTDHVVTVSRDINIGDASYKRLPVGSKVLLFKDKSNGSVYQFVDRWHIPGIATLFLILLLLVVVVGWWRGITSIFGLVISIGVLSGYVLPQILSGHSAYAACLQGAFIITAISIYIAHGFSKRTTVAYVSSLITLLAIVGLVGFATYVTGSSEVIDENTITVLDTTHPISLAGIFTGGVVIASLGILYDITTGQAAAVDEIYKAHNKQSGQELFRKGLSVGREHIAALVNTLALVYVGVALPSIVITALYNGHAPLMVILNGEPIVEEVVRTCVASIGMLLAVPITTAIAAYVLPHWDHKVDTAIKQWLHEL